MTEIWQRLRVTYLASKMNDTDSNVLEWARSEGIRSEALIRAATLLHQQRNVRSSTLGIIAVTKPGTDRRSLIWTLPSLWRDASVSVLVVPTRQGVHSALDLAQERGIYALFWTDTLHVNFDLSATVRANTHILVIVGPIEAVLSPMYASMLESLRRSHWLSQITLEDIQKLQDTQFSPYIPQLGRLDNQGHAACPVVLTGVDASGRLERTLRVQLQTAWKIGRDVALRVLDHSTLQAALYEENSLADSPVRFIVSDICEWDCRTLSERTTAFSTEAAAWMRGQARRCEDDERWMIVCVSALDVNEVVWAMQTIYRVHVGLLATYVFGVAEGCDEATLTRTVGEWRSAKRSVLVLTTVEWERLNLGREKSVRLIVLYGGSLRVSVPRFGSSRARSVPFIQRIGGGVVEDALARIGSSSEQVPPTPASQPLPPLPPPPPSTAFFDPIALLNRHLRDARGRITYTRALRRGMGCAEKMEFIELCLVDHGCKRKYLVCHIHDPKVHWVECSPILLTHTETGRGEASSSGSFCAACHSARQRVSIRFARTSTLSHAAEDETMQRDENIL